MNTDVGDDRERIEELYRGSAAALAGGDLAALSAYYTDDAIQLPPDAAPRVGWPAIRASLVEELEGITFDSTIDVSEIVVVGELAYAWGHYRATVSTLPGGRPAMTSGSFLDILVRQPDGRWKIARSAWSTYRVGKNQL